MPLLTPKEAAAELRVSLITLRRHIGNGAIPVTIIGTGVIRPRYAIEAAEIERFKEQRRRLQTRSESTWQSGDGTTRTAHAKSSSNAEGSDIAKWWRQQQIEKLGA